MMGSLSEDEMNKAVSEMKTHQLDEEKSHERSQNDIDKNQLIEDQISTSDDLIELAKQ